MAQSVYMRLQSVTKDAGGDIYEFEPVPLPAAVAEVVNKAFLDKIDPLGTRQKGAVASAKP